MSTLAEKVLKVSWRIFNRCPRWDATGLSVPGGDQGLWCAGLCDAHSSVLGTTDPLIDVGHQRLGKQ